MNKTHQKQVYTMHGVVDGGRHINQAHLRCAGPCRHVESIHIRPDMPPDQVLKKFRQRGWQVDIKHAARNFCPDCKSRKTANNNQPKGEIMKHQPEAIIPMPEMPVVRKILSIVEGHFDEEKGRYIGDWSDKKVSAEIGIPWGVIAKVREESGLKIKGNPELLALRSEIDTWIDMGKQLDHRLRQIENR
jgi:hypothetical protein